MTLKQAMRDKKQIKMVSDLRSLAGTQQGVSGDISLQEIDGDDAQTLMTMLGNNSDKVWDKEDVEEFMNNYHSQQSLTEFLEE